MRNRSDKKRFLRKLAVKLIAFGVVIIGLFILVDIRVRPIIEKTSSYQSRILATRIINQSVYGEINSEQYDYEKLVNLKENETGTVTSLETNMVTINRLKTQITQVINEGIKGIDEHELGISLGTLSGIHILYGQGPEIPIKVAPKGYASTQLVSEFTSAGINQTLHRIILNVSVDISAIIPGYTTSVKVETTFIIAETAIIGNVPEAYTHIISGSSDLINDISDYGARISG